MMNPIPWFQQPLYCPHCQAQVNKKGKPTYAIERAGSECFKRSMHFLCEMCGIYFTVWRYESMNTEPETDDKS